MVHTIREIQIGKYTTGISNRKVPANQTNTNRNIQIGKNKNRGMQNRQYESGNANRKIHVGQYNSKNTIRTIQIAKITIGQYKSEI